MVMSLKEADRLARLQSWRVSLQTFPVSVIRDVDGERMPVFGEAPGEVMVTVIPRVEPDGERWRSVPIRPRHLNRSRAGQRAERELSRSLDIVGVAYADPVKAVQEYRQSIRPGECFTPNLMSF